MSAFGFHNPGRLRPPAPRPAPDPPAATPLGRGLRGPVTGVVALTSLSDLFSLLEVELPVNSAPFRGRRTRHAKPGAQIIYQRYPVRSTVLMYQADHPESDTRGPAGPKKDGGADNKGGPEGEGYSTVEVEDATVATNGPTQGTTAAPAQLPLGSPPEKALSPDPSKSPSPSPERFDLNSYLGFPAGGLPDLGYDPEGPFLAPTESGRLEDDFITDIIFDTAATLGLGLLGQFSMFVGGAARAAMSVVLTRTSAPASGSAGTDSVNTGMKLIEDYLGSGAKARLNEAGDLIITSVDNAKQIRFDFNRAKPHANPHIHAGDKRAYPRDVTDLDRFTSQPKPESRVEVRFPLSAKSQDVKQLLSPLNPEIFPLPRPERGT